MSKFRKRLTDNAGFTLIELLVVIAVLGILAGIAVPRLGGVTDKAKDAAVESFAGAVKTGMEMYYVEHDESYPSFSSSTTFGALATNLDTVTDEDSLDKYNIDSISFTDNSSDTTQYLINFTADSDNVYYLGELGFSDTDTEASDLGGS